jgi:polyphosphate glucokinase
VTAGSGDGGDGWFGGGCSGAAISVALPRRLVPDARWPCTRETMSCMAQILGIDIGGTGIKGAPVDTRTGDLLGERFRIPTPQPARPDAVAEVVAAVATHFRWTGPLGVTFPAVVKRGIAMTAANVDKSWIGTDAASLFTKATGSPVTVINDADAAGIAEMEFGAGRGRHGVVIMTTLGTGIGSALFFDGQLVPNTELGHLEIDGKDAESRAAESVREQKGLSWEQWAKRLTVFYETLARLFSPDLFIVGGGVSKKADRFLPLIKTRVEIVPAELLNEAGIVGAAVAAVRSHP